MSDITIAVVVAGAAAFVAMLYAALRKNRRQTLIWGGAWLACVAVVGISVAWSMRALWAGPTNAEMDGLIAELRRAYPEQIAAISYENAPPLDPPMIFIDTAESMSASDDRRFVCVDVLPRVHAANNVIDVSSTWADSDDCGLPDYIERGSGLTD